MKFGKVLGLLVLLLLIPGSLLADSVTLTFLDNGGPMQVTVNGAPLSCGSNESCTVDTFGAFTVPSTFNQSFNIYEPDGVTLSDTLNIIAGTAVNEIATTFLSAGGAPLTPLANGTTIIENGSVQTATTIPFTQTDGTTLNIVVQFQSAAGPAVTAEPSSLLLLGTGLVCLLGAMRGKRLA